MSDKRTEVQPTLDMQWVTISRGKQFVHVPLTELEHVVDVLRQVLQDASCAACGKVAHTWGTVPQCADCLADEAERNLPA